MLAPRSRPAAMDAIDSVVDPLRDFAKDSVRLVKRCHKPDRKGACQATSIRPVRIRAVSVPPLPDLMVFTCDLDVQSSPRSRRGRRSGSSSWASSASSSSSSSSPSTTSSSGQADPVPAGIYFAPHASPRSGFQPPSVKFFVPHMCNSMDLLDRSKSA